MLIQNHFSNPNFNMCVCVCFFFFFFFFFFSYFVQVKKIKIDSKSSVNGLHMYTNLTPQISSHFNKNTFEFHTCKMNHLKP